MLYMYSMIYYNLNEWDLFYEPQSLHFVIQLSIELVIKSCLLNTAKIRLVRYLTGKKFTAGNVILIVFCFKLLLGRDKNVYI